MATTPTLDVVANAMLNVLASFLPAPIGGLPAPNVIMTNLRERSAGLGRHIGFGTVADMSLVALKGIRLEGTARFQLWAAAPADVDSAVSTLNTNILAALGNLYSQGFLKISMREAKPADHIDTVGWRRAADYRVLYEFPFQDSDDSQSILVRIPISIDSSFNQSTVVTDEMARWDNLAAPALRARGPRAITAISALSFIPGPSPSGSVTLLRTFDGAAGPPTVHLTLPDFLNAVTGNPPAERKATVSFASINDFLTALGAAGNPINMGDWNNDGIPDHQYLPRTLAVQPALRLQDVVDRFEITYSAPAFDQVAVLYLRLSKSVLT
jgi:hypothetical protein